MNSASSKLLRRYPVISEQIEKRELSVILRECEVMLSAAPANTSIVEFGCYEGTASLFLQRLLLALQKDSSFHVYDSFAGLPPKSEQDQSPVGEQFVEGELYASKQAFVRNFQHAGLPLPAIHKGWFNELTPRDIPANICFAFLDGDYYHSITDSLRLIWPNLASHATIVVDDYQNEALPGARRAIEDWLSTRRAVLRVEASLAILTISR